MKLVPLPVTPESVSPETTTFEGCYERYRRRVYHWALRYGGGDTHWAEDLTHDVFMKLFEHLSALEDRDDLGGWLYRVTANLALGRLRREQSWTRRWLPRYRDAQPESEPAADFLFEQRESGAAALSTLRTLPARERLALCMKVLDGKSQKEIAATLGLSEGYVSKLIARGWARVRAAGWEVGE